MIQRYNGFTSTIGERPVFAPSPEGDWVKWEEVEVVLDKLARLGNEPHFGNSRGNEIALEALRGGFNGNA